MQAGLDPESTLLLHPFVPKLLDTLYRESLSRDCKLTLATSDRFDRCTFLFVVAWLLILQILKSASAAPTAADSAVIQYPDYTNGALLRRPIQKPMVHDPPNRKQLLPTDVINNIETPSDSGSQENAAGETKWTLQRSGNEVSITYFSDP
uniref:Uncharacterized protein n=1 Tax=Romanomermis culicivorax TaxID=13658 RepID=A0A915IJJ4_ROMCU